MIRLAYLRWKRRALRRERARLWAERAGYDAALAINERDEREVECEIAVEDERLRRERFDRRYGVKNG